jgi:hypothetical protein
MIEPIIYDDFPFRLEIKFPFDRVADPTVLGWHTRADDTKVNADAWKKFDERKWGIIRVEIDLLLGKVRFGQYVCHEAYGDQVPQSAYDSDDHYDDYELEYAKVDLDEIRKRYEDKAFLNNVLASEWENSMDYIPGLFAALDRAFDSVGRSSQPHIQLRSLLTAPNPTHIENVVYNLARLGVDTAPLMRTITLQKQQQRK